MMRWLEYTIFLALVVGLVNPVGLYLARVFERKPTFLDQVLCPMERVLYRVFRINPEHEMSAPVYLVCFILFTVLGTVLLFAVLLLQAWLPGGPHERYLATPMPVDLAVNTAVSFATTTTWQAYGGETTLRYLTQVFGLAAQNFLAGAAGLAVGIAFIRGFARERSATIGNFWFDLVRATLWVLLPLSLIGSLALVWQGVPFNLAPYAEAHTLEGQLQSIAQGPVAALEFVKNLGTNGGGFFNANGAHPYANPTPLTNLLGLLAIAVLPASLTFTFGLWTNRERSGRLLLAVMVTIFTLGLALCDFAEKSIPSQLTDLNVSGGNLEGKELRFGVGGSVLATLVTSNGATGSYNSMIDSYKPVGVVVPLMNMFLGEVVFGGLGTGLQSVVMLALVGVLLGGLMVGRTPEYLGKAITPAEAKLLALYALATPFTVLTLSSWALSTEMGRAGLVTHTGPHALTEVLFAYASNMANNGMTMAGLNANNVFYNTTTVVAMLAGRFWLVGLALALAGRFAAQRRRPVSLGSLPSDTVTFGVLVIGTVLLVGALSFLPALALGPLMEFLAA